ncbi:MAG TPA: TylF/MycF/NovP-related O-methyltransferase, partial [Holophagaceae bacterium]|nr:TylF/MycF/NovP-related O-methyltransferase [Holophagaceae bacterium]
RRDLHLFDAFTEICEPDEKVDGARAVAEVKTWTRNQGGTEGRLKALTGIYDAFGGPGTLEENRTLLETTIGYDPDRIHYHQGWFQDTLPLDAGKIGPIALLRLDGDWYASTKVCLEHLYDHVVSSGIVIIDDYGTYEGCRKAVDEFIAARGLRIFLSHVDPDCRYWIKP